MTPPEGEPYTTQHSCVPYFTADQMNAYATQPPAPAQQTEASDLLAGWSITDACQAVDYDGEIMSGVWELGARDGDGNFYAIATVDTDNYDQPEAAEPLARAILARLATPPAPALPPVAMSEAQLCEVLRPLADEFVASANTIRRIVRAVEKFHGIEASTGEPS